MFDRPPPPPPAIVRAAVEEAWPSRPPAARSTLRARRPRRAARPAVPARGPGQFGPGDIYARLPPVDSRGEDQVAKFLAWNPDPIANGPGNLGALDLRLAAIVRRAAAERPDVPFVIGSGRRGLAEQKQAEAWGWAPPRRAATLEAYLASPQGRHVKGEAVDLWPLDAHGHVVLTPAALVPVAAAVKGAAAALGTRILWGGDFRHRKDWPHFELRGE